MILFTQKPSQNAFFNYSNTKFNNDQFVEETLKYYTLFGHSTSFFLGERLLAEYFLPSTKAFR